MVHKIVSETNLWLKQINENLRKLQKEDQLAKKKGQLVGRYIQESYADGHAVYKIVKEFKNKVRIRVVTGIGDDWRIPYWGEEATIDKKYAVESIAHRDRVAKLFKK